MCAIYASIAKHIYFNHVTHQPSGIIPCNREDKGGRWQRSPFLALRTEHRPQDQRFPHTDQPDQQRQSKLPERIQRTGQAGGGFPHSGRRGRILNGGPHIHPYGTSFISKAHPSSLSEFHSPVTSRSGDFLPSKDGSRSGGCSD